MAAAYQHPRDLPPDWFSRWEERAAIMHEGCKLPATEAGIREANRRAFADILRQMMIEDDRSLRSRAS